MNRLSKVRRLLTIAILFCRMNGLSSAQGSADDPETVMITLHAKPGAERELQSALERHWATVRRMRLAGSAAHVTIRVVQDGNKVAFIHVFTWRNSKIPDSAPPAIQKIWADMNALVEARGGHPGLEIATVSMVRP